MSQQLYFLKTKCFSEQTVQKSNIARENVYEAIKAIFRGGDAHASEMIERYFELIEPIKLVIGINEFKEISPDFSTNLKLVFDKKSSSLFMVFQQEWNVIEQIVEKRTKEIINQKNNSPLDERLKEVSEIFRDYILLKNLYDGNILFGQIS
jgi:hypothetical protein